MLVGGIDQSTVEIEKDGRVARPRGHRENPV